MCIFQSEALRIAQDFADEVCAAFKERILAVYATGSLAGGYYRPGQSDIDTLVLTRCARADLPLLRPEIRSIADRYQQRYRVPKGFGAIVFAREQLFPPYVAEEELVLEILRLKTQSTLLRGSFHLDDVPSPDRRAIIEDARAFERWAASQRKKADPDACIHTPEMLVNSTLIALKRYLLIAHGVVEFNKFKVMDQYLAHQPPLVDDEVFAFLRAQLHSGGGQVSRAQFERCLRWHDELYRTVNRLTLSQT